MGKGQVRGNVNFELYSLLRWKYYILCDTLFLNVVPLLLFLSLSDIMIIDNKKEFSYEKKQVINLIKYFQKNEIGFRTGLWNCKVLW